MEHDIFIPKKLIPVMDYFQNQAQYLFLPELLESSLFFNTAAASQLVNIRIHRETRHGIKKIIPNFYAIMLVNSGTGKNMSVELTAEPFKEMFEIFVERAQAFTLNPTNRNNKNELEPQYIKISHQYTPSASSVQGVQKYAQTISDLGFGSVNIFEDELGDSIMAMSQIFSKMKTGFDTGMMLGDVNVSAGGDNYFTIDDIAINAMLMGSPGIFEQQPKLKEQLLSYLISGVSRRSYVFHNTSYKKSENRNHEYDEMGKEDIELAKDYFLELRSHINNLEHINMPKSVHKELIQYDIQKEVLRENSESVLSDNLGAPGKIERLAAIICVLDLETTVSSDHLKYAISYTERVDETTEAAHRIKPLYEQIYDILSMRGFISRTELMKEIKTLNIKNLDDEIMLATELASQLGNSIVIKEYSGIIKYKLERLTATKLDKVILSINEDPSETRPDGFTKIEGDWKDLWKVPTSKRRYSAGTFLNNYIKDTNYLSEQNILIFDFDEGMQIEEAKGLFKSIKYLIVTTKSHQKAKGSKPACDRFRLFIPTLSKFHLKPEIYSIMYETIMNALGMESSDISCRNVSRWYFPYEQAEYWYNPDDSAELLDIRSFIPDTSESIAAEKNLASYQANLDQSVDQDESSRRKAGMLSWLIRNTSAGQSRNDNCFKYGMFIKTKIPTLNPSDEINAFNAILTEPLGMSEITKICNSVARRN